MADPTAELKATKAALQALQPLDEEQTSRALRWLGEVLGVSSHVPDGPDPSTIPAPAAPVHSYEDAHGANSPATGSDPAMSPEEFIASKRPTNSAERIACLGYYLSEHRGTRHFETPDIVALNTEAAQSKFGNPGRDMDNADRSSGYLTSAGDGRKQVSARGKALVRALPDREAVKAALQDHPLRRGKAAAKKATGSNGASDSTAPKAPRKATKRATSSTSRLAKP